MAIYILIWDLPRIPNETNIGPGRAVPSSPLKWRENYSDPSVLNNA